MVVGLVAILAWHPWASPSAVPSSALPASTPAIGLSSAAPFEIPAEGGLPTDLLGGPMVGPWSGRVAAQWSIVAFLRADPVSRDPLDLRQQQVMVFLGPVHPPISRAPEYCDEVGPTGERAAAELPTREVRFLGIAFPGDRTVDVDGVVRLGQAVGAIPVELGRIPSVGVDGVPSASASRPPVSDVGSPGPSGSPPGDPVRMFGLPGGGPWPDGLYRFDVVTGDGAPAQLYACIRP
jgi:hypothetical protein